MNDQRVLLIRVNAGTEVLRTRGAVDAVRARFPDASLVALATPQTEALELLKSDPRLEEVLLFPPDGTAKSPAAFRQFMARQNFQATVVCYGATPGVDYRRHILSILACPGRRFFLDAHDRLFSLRSGRGIHLVLLAAASLLGQRAAGRVARWLEARLESRQSPSGSRNWGLLGLLLASGGIKKMLWVRLDHIGDVVMTLPVIAAIKARFPDIRMEVLTSPTSAALVSDQPFIDGVLTYEAPHLARGVGRRPRAGLLAVAARLRGRYDLAIDLRGDDVARQLMWLSGVPRRLGPTRGPYEPPDRLNAAFLLTDVLPPVREGHTVDDNLRLLDAAHIPRPTLPFRLVVTEERRRSADARLSALGVAVPYAVVHARSGQAFKDWCPERFAAVVDYLITECRLDVLLTGAADDRDYVAQIARAVRRETRVHNAAGLFPLAELPALLHGAALMVTVDTGPMHIAAAVGTPVVALIVPWYVEKFAPYGQTGRVLTSAAAPRGMEALLDGVTVSDVVHAVDRILAQTGGGAGTLEFETRS